MEKLLREYSKLRDELMPYTMKHFDYMSYDIDGYWEADEDDVDIDILKNQISAFKILLKGYKKINYIYC